MELLFTILVNATPGYHVVYLAVTSLKRTITTLVMRFSSPACAARLEIAKRCDGMPPADPEQPTVDWRKDAATAIRRLLDLSGYGRCGYVGLHRLPWRAINLE
jgi:hypothetical protein